MNIDKVLHGLSSCGTDHGIPNICEVTECPYREDKAWCVHELAHDAGMLIKELLTTRTEVVRCSECRFAAPQNNVTVSAFSLECKCPYLNTRYVAPEWFCEHGEKK